MNDIIDNAIAIACNPVQGRRKCRAERGLGGGVVIGEPHATDTDSAMVEITTRIFTGTPMSMSRADVVSLVERASTWRIVGYEVKEIS